MDISREQYEALKAKYDALLTASYYLCKYLDEAEQFNSSSYRNQARVYRRQTQNLIKKENEERKSKQNKLF